MANDAPDRKLAAILHMDVVGYSRLMGEDETGTHRRLIAYLGAITGIITAHGGRVVNTAGDALLADFSTVSDALDCAMACQIDLKARNQVLPKARQVRFRIGVNLGEVIVDGEDIYGEGVNIAARLESLAEPGGICISGTVYDAIGSKLASLHYVFLGEQSVKNIAQPVRVYRVETAAEAIHTPPPCPYPGMVPFTKNDAAHFYGRDQEISRMIQLLRRQRFLMVIGPSGSGKSSLIYAGLLPALAQSRYFDEGYWLVRAMRPGPNPGKVLAGILDSDGEHGEFGIDTVAALLKAHPPAQRLLLLVDQFEEVFTQAERGQRAKFIAELQALRAPENCALILTLRADFYPDLMTSYLWPVDASQRVEVAPLRGEALREAIEKPAADVGVRLEPHLVDQLLADAADEPGVLPLLQETMGLLWDEIEHRELSYRTYKHLSTSTGQLKNGAPSGLAVAIAMKADTVLAELTPNQQTIARRIFLRLIQFGEGRADTRRQQPVEALRAANDTQGAFEQTLEHLTHHRLLTRSGGDDQYPPAVDISHEVLINGWSRLQDWADERREAEQIRRRLEGKAAEWVRLGKGNGGLLSDVELPEAEHWLASQDAQELGYDRTLPELIAASQQAIEEAEQAQASSRQRELAQAQTLAEEKTRTAERMRRAMFGLAAVLLIAAAAGLFAWSQSQKAQLLAGQEALARAEAETLRLEAEQLAKTEAQARVEAEGQRLASIAQLLLIKAPQQIAIYEEERSVLLARQGFLMSGGLENLHEQADQVLRNLLSMPWFALSLSQHYRAQGIALSPDGQTLAVSEPVTKQLLLWNLSYPGRPPAIRPGHPSSPLTAIAYSPDGNTLLAGSADGNLLRWNLQDVNTGTTVVGSISGGIWSVAISPDGVRFAVGGQQNETIWLWNETDISAGPTPFRDAETTAAANMAAQSAGGVPVAFSPDGKMFASGGLSGIIRLWEPDNPNTPVRVLKGHTDAVWSLAFSPDGKRLASAGKDTTIRLWELTAPDRQAAVLRGHEEEVLAIAFSPDSSRLASGSNDNTVRLWSMSRREASPITLRGTGTDVHAVLFSPDGSRLVSAGRISNGLRVWDLTPSGQPVILQGDSGPVISLDFSPDGGTLASAHSRKAVRLWDLADPNAQPLVLRGHEDKVSSVAFSPDGKLLASGGADKTLRLWRLDNLTTPIAVFHENKYWLWYAPFSPDGKLLAGGDGHGVVRLWNPADPSLAPEVLQLATVASVQEVAFSPDGSMLAAASHDGTIHLRNPDNPDIAEIILHGHAGTVRTVAFSPDNHTLASGGDDTKVRLWNMLKPESPPSILGQHQKVIFRSRFSPDGKLLATASADQSVRLWHVDNTGESPALLYGHEGIVLTVAFSPDGKTLATGASNGTIRLWDITHPVISLGIESLADKVCEKVWRNLTIDEWYQFVGQDIPYERTCPNLPVHPSLFETAEKLAASGDQTDAVELLERAVELDPDLNINPRQEVERWKKADSQ